MRRALVLLAFLCACPSRRVDPPRASGADRVAIAKLEATRGGGVDELIARAQTGDAGTRDLALRALGRVGGPRALDALIAALGDPSPAIANRAAASIGVLASLSDPPPAVLARTSAALVALFDREGIDAAVVAEALGRAGDASAMGPLAARATSKDAPVAAAASAAVLRLGRREIALDRGTQAALITATTSDSADVRHAAVVALGREFRGKPPAPADAAVTKALALAIGDADAEVRAAAIDGLRRHQAVAAGATQIEQALQDADWRVAVQAAKALGGADGTDAGRDAVAAVLVKTWTLLADGGAPARAQVLLEGLRAIAPSSARPNVRSALDALVTLAAEPGRGGSLSPLVRGWTHCLASAAIGRAAPEQFGAAGGVLGCGNGALAPHYQAELIGELIAAKVGLVPDRFNLIRAMLKDADPPTRAVGLAAIPAVWPDVTDADRKEATGWVAGELAGATAPVAVGTAAETVKALLELEGVAPELRAALSASLIERAARETDPEVAGGLLDTLAQGKIADGKGACEHGARAVSPVIRAAAARCLAALAGGDGADKVFEEPAAAARPAADAADVIGKTVIWHVTTTRGEVTIALDPDVAPWHVATIAALTQKKFYDGLVFHRVVPDFVVQGGDPTGTGWGGPGFTLPSEPGTRLDGDSYARGAVGIADAGKDSGSSQWFAMHSRAEYLEGRYTRIGRVTSGQDVVDALVVGDAIVRATVEIR
jgi:peptidyl-prolyl cis-trans isomerase B (cyclophilin B)